MATDWSDWIGREARAAERLDESLAARWLATLDLTAPEGAVLPQGIHFALCTPQAPTAMLGEDGHPARSRRSTCPGGCGRAARSRSCAP